MHMGINLESCSSAVALAIEEKLSARGIRKFDCLLVFPNDVKLRVWYCQRHLPTLDEVRQRWSRYVTAGISGHYFHRKLTNLGSFAQVLPW
jgi:hypothetical protein